MGKFDKILKKNRGVAVFNFILKLILKNQPEDIKQLFPDDKELYEKILSIREKSLEKSSLASRMMSPPQTEIKSIKTDNKTNNDKSKIIFL